MSRPCKRVTVSESATPLTAIVEPNPSGAPEIRISSVSVDRTSRNSRPSRKKKNPTTARTIAQVGMYLRVTRMTPGPAWIGVVPGNPLILMNNCCCATSGG
jgi:hypothetical protein